MKAIVCTKYGPPDVLQLADVEKPTPKVDEVLVEVHAASINKADWYIMRGKPFLVRIMDGGLLRPKHRILGSDIAGSVEAVGKNVKQFQPGDEVFGNLSSFGHGAFAEYVSVPEKALAFKPTNISFQESAAVPLAGLTALQGIRDIGKIQPGQKVLINGASGGVGTFAVQIAKSLGAEVTAVCSTKKVEMARSIGADHVIDYSKEDFTKKENLYDQIIAVNGYHPILDYKGALTSDGMYVMIGGSLSQIFQAILLGPMIFMTASKKIGTVSLEPNKEDLFYMKELIEANKVKPVIDRHYLLSEVPNAFKYLEEGHSVGKVVINMK